jgi:hypothetical protein
MVFRSFSYISWVICPIDIGLESNPDPQKSINLCLILSSSCLVALNDVRVLAGGVRGEDGRVFGEPAIIFWGLVSHTGGDSGLEDGVSRRGCALEWFGMLRHSMRGMVDNEVI